MHGSKRAWMGWRAVCLGLTGALLFGCGAAGSGGIGAGNPDAAAPPGGRDTGVSPDGGEQPQTDAAVSPPDAAALPPDLAEPPPDC